MKLFQKLLLTPAVFGLFTPITATASEANLMDVSNYSQVDVEVTQDTFKPLSSKNPLLAGGEGLNQNISNSFDGDSFSSTTTAAFSSNFVLGTVDKSNLTEKVTFVYDYAFELTSSISGNDSLTVAWEVGNNATLPDLDITNANTADTLQIDGITYTTDLGERLTVFVGNGGASGNLLYNSACVYGGQTDVLDDCGIRSTNLDEGLGTSMGATFDIGYGLTAAIGYEGQANGTKGFASEAGVDAFGGQVAYSGDNFGLAVAFASIENHDDDGRIHGDDGVTTSSAFSAYYAPELEMFPSISVGIESSHDDSAAANADETSNYFVGIQWDELGNGTLGAAFGSKEPTRENVDAEKMYELFYSYNYADGITITPVLFIKEESTLLNGENVDETGLVVKTTFSF